MHRSIPALLGALAAAAPTGGALAALHHGTAVKPKAKKALAKPRKVEGPSVDMRWGSIQVTLVVRGTRVTDVQATAPMDRPRSNFINSQVVPFLRGEVLKLQSANVDVISGATMTCEAYAQSLQAALDKARLGKTASTPASSKQA